MTQDYHITFESPELSSVVLKNLYEQQKANRFCDLTLYVNSKMIKVHRNVLAGNSPYFDSILKQHKIVKEHLTISCLDSEIFDSFIVYMYTGKITIHIANVEELLRLANHFIVNKIIEYCTEFLEKSLNIDNCLLIFDLVRKYNLRNISALDNILSTKLNDIINGNEMLNLSAEKLQDFIKHEALNIPVIKALEIFTAWVLKDRQNREKDFPKLLNTIQWISVDHNDISKHIETCFLYTNSDKCFYNILSALIQNNILLPNYKNRYEELHYKYSQNFSETNNSGEKSEEKDGILNDTKNENQGDDNKGNITVSDSNDSNDSDKKNVLKLLIVKAKQKSYKQRFIRRLLLNGLKPNLRVASMKTVFCKKKISVLNIKKKIEEVYSDEKTGVKCPICSTTINDSLLLEQHLALSHAKDVTYKCGICTFVCQYHGDYLTHMKNHFPGPPYKCDYCEHTTDQISKLLTHRAHHSDEMVYHCTFCSFKCRSKQNLLSHLRLHTTDKQYKCEECDKTFRFKRSLEQHAISHTAEKMMVCDTCGFSTKFVSHMIAHKRMHAGDGDVYRCSFPHCKYTTAKKNQLTSHAKTHNGVRPHSCGVCGRGFMEKSHLVRHERIHLDEKPFKCSQCDYASSRRDKLKEHFTRHHGENASAKVPYKARPLRNGNGNSTATATSTVTNGGNNNNSNNNGSNNRPKTQPTQEPPSTSTSSANTLNFPTPPTNNTTPSNTPTQPIGNEIQDLIMHHQNHPSSSSSAANSTIPSLNSHNYHHFGDPTDFHHHHSAHAHNLPHQLLATHGTAQRVAQHQSAAANSAVNHHMLARGAGHPSAATSTAAAVAAAMMLDPRFHHNGSVPYHPNTTPVSMAMAAVQSSQQIQNATQHGEYPPSLQNCMTLF